MRRKGLFRRSILADLGPLQQAAVRNVAHLVSRLLAEPFDAIRLTQFVGSPLSGPNMWSTAKNMYHAGGLMSFFSLFPLHHFQTLLGQRVGYRAIASMILDYFPIQRRSAWRYSVLTTLSQLLFAITTHPMEIIRVRMRCVELTPFAYSSALDCLIDLLEHDGVASLFQGLSCAPIGAIWSSFGRLVSSEILSWLSSQKIYSPNIFTNSVESIFSGLTGTLISQPFYLVQKKMMVSYEMSRGRLPSEAMLKGVTPQSSSVTTALAIYDQHGFAGFWSGALSNSIRHATINTIEDGISVAVASVLLRYNQWCERKEDAQVETDTDDEEDYVEDVVEGTDSSPAGPTSTPDSPQSPVPS
eukprot:TRINITY_DN2222_c0_g3_i1.p1 TRINITY_DN2222_c0_g3~~TRINITY_DN2222_c0_g3_i1.p1  ORF type:complete len:357 (+),score=22.90 TRINITY_DN2222_c0_g3_i1:62-1132(+)